MRRIKKYARMFDSMLGGPWGEIARGLEARRAQVARVRVVLADWRKDMGPHKGKPDDLTLEELVEIERVLKVVAVAHAETERLSALYESVAMRLSALEQTTQSRAGTGDRPAQAVNPDK